MKIRPIKYGEMKACEALVAAQWGNDAGDRCYWQALEMFKGGPYAPTFYAATPDNSDDMIGFAAMRPMMLMPNSFEFIWIVVDAQHQRRGVGEALTKHRLEEVKKAGGTLVHLVTQKYVFFSKQGFHLVETYSDGWILMAKRLGLVTMV